MTVLVTGASGFIGSRVVLNLGKREIPIVAADLDLGQNKSKLEKKYIDLGFKKILIISECGFGHVPIEITRLKIRKLAEVTNILRKNN